MEELRYSVSIKKGYKIFFVICCAICLGLMAVTGILGIPACETWENYAAIIGCMVFFFCGAMLGLYEISKKVLVYKGKIVYCTMLKRVEYKPSEVHRSKTKIEANDYHDEYGTWFTYDKVTTFYNKEGKKLFAFGLCYNNVEKLKKNIENNRKSIQEKR